MVATKLPVPTDEEAPVAAGRPHWSYSRLNRYLLCPQQYRYYYIDRLRPRIPAATLAFGGLIHQALAAFFRGEMSDPVEYFQGAWALLEEVELRYGTRDTFASLGERGERILTRFVEEEASKIDGVSAVEGPFELTVTGLGDPLVGVIDLKAELDGVPTVIDFKTSATSYGIHEAGLSDQLTVYALAEPDVEQVAFCVLVKTKEPKIEWHTATRSAADISGWLGKAAVVAGGVHRQEFYRRPGSWCAWCDFLPLCLGNQRKAAESLVQLEPET